MSNAVLSRRNGKAVRNGREPEPGPMVDETISIDQAVKEDVQVAVAAITASTAPTLSMQSRDALLKAYEDSFDRSVKSIGSILDNTALAVYCQVGEHCHDTVFRAKNLLDAETQDRLGKDAKSTWKADDFDDQCHRLSTRCRVLFPHLFAPSKEKADEAEAKGRKKDPVRVSDYILAYLAVNAIKALTGDSVHGLSYYLIVNYVARKVVTFSRSDLTCTMKSDWAEFVRVTIPRLASGKILVRDFLSLMDEHEAKLDRAERDSKHAGKTPEQVAQIEATEAAKKATREKNAKIKRVRSALEDSLLNAMTGVLDPAEISRTIANAAQSANVHLPVSALNPETITVDEILDTLKAMFMAKRFDEVRAVVNGCAAMAPMLESFGPKPSQPVANAG